MTLVLVSGADRRLAGLLGSTRLSNSRCGVGGDCQGKKMITIKRAKTVPVAIFLKWVEFFSVYHSQRHQDPWSRDETHLRVPEKRTES